MVQSPARRPLIIPSIKISMAALDVTQPVDADKVYWDETTDWISARETIEYFTEKSDHPEAALLRCVTHHNCQSRGNLLLLDGQAVATKALLLDHDDQFI
jgi:hypothetical protein